MLYDHIKVERVFVGAGCNRIVNNVSWAPCDLVAFGAQHAVAIFCPKISQIWTTLAGHKSVINCTYWLPSNRDAPKAWHNQEHLLFSGSADGLIILWGISHEARKWRLILTAPKAHNKGVTCITAIVISQNAALVASTSSDGLTYIWKVIVPSDADDAGDCRLLLLESLAMGSKPMVSISFAELPGKGGLILAMGGLDNRVHLYCGELCGKFIYACELRGHTDWIRSLDFSLPIVSSDGEKFLLLVSASQDRTIRMWKIALHISEGLKMDDAIGLTSYIKGPLFNACGSFYQVSLESLLIGHEDWVYSVKWQPPIRYSQVENKWHQPPSILSASMDKTMMIWRPERTTGIWVNVVVVGEFSHSAFGFFGGQWGPKGDSILAYDYGGSFHMWKNMSVDTENWQPQVVPSGHIASVTDIAWARSGEFLLSVSHDQTARIFAPWAVETHEGDNSWHEIARPQIHGHDINCVSIIQGQGNHRFICGAEEKVARVFEAPLSFLKTLNRTMMGRSNCIINPSEDNQVLGASMSALGLSQKPIYIRGCKPADIPNSDDSYSTEVIPDASPVALLKPPMEEQLAWHTLWPETHKLYGHGNELFSLCSDHEGQLVASSCKAQSAAVAEIWLWETASWKAVGRLPSHNLTVVQMEFSFDDRFLLAVSRDRCFSIFSIKTSDVGEITHELVARIDAHKRIIWACSWSPYRHHFATGSRDRTVKVWEVDHSSVKQLTALRMFRSSVTALAWTGLDYLSDYGCLAVGMEDGLIELWGLCGGLASGLLVQFDPFMCHVSVVRHLSWKNHAVDETRAVHLASCGDDHSLRIFLVKFI